MFVDATTSREDLLTAIYGEGVLLDTFICLGLDPEEMETEEVRAIVMKWIEDGDEYN
jgi:hypothetical protein